MLNNCCEEMSVVCGAEEEIPRITSPLPPRPKLARYCTNC